MRCRCSLHVLFVLLSFFALTGVAEASSGVLVGNPSVAGSTYSQGTEWAQAFEFTAVASSPAASASVYVDAGSSATSLDAGLYNTCLGASEQAPGVRASLLSPSRVRGIRLTCHRRHRCQARRPTGSRCSRRVVL